MLAWVAADSIVSFRAGVSLEVLFNAIVVVLIALPLAMTYRSVVSGPAPAGGVVAASRAVERIAP